MGARITRPSSGDGAPTLTLSEEILFKVSRGASSIYSTLLSLLRRDAPSPEHELVFRREQWVRISDAKIDAPKPGYALVVDPATTANGTIRVRMYDADAAKAARLLVPETEMDSWCKDMRVVVAESGARGVVTDGRRKAAVRTRDVSGARGAARVRREGRSPERPSR